MFGRDKRRIARLEKEVSALEFKEAQREIREDDARLREHGWVYKNTGERITSMFTDAPYYAWFPPKRHAAKLRHKHYSKKTALKIVGYLK